jgi:hypothetical protein
MSGLSTPDPLEGDPGRDVEVTSGVGSGVVDEVVVRALAKAAGIAIPEQDVTPLVAGLQRQLERMEALKPLELERYEPLVTFDPRWL